MTVWLPTESDDVVKVACPEVMATLAARVVEPSVKFTVPVGVPVYADVTLAVTVITWPNTDGLAAELTVVVLGAFSTVGAACEDTVKLLLLLLYELSELNPEPSPITECAPLVPPVL